MANATKQAAPAVTEDPRFKHAFPTLSEEYISFLEPLGKRMTFKKDDRVWSAGETDACMHVVIRGAIDIIDQLNRKIATLNPGAFSGELDILAGTPKLVSGVAAADSEVLKVPGDCVRSIVGERPELGELILRAFLARRALLIEELHVGPLIIGSRFCPDTLRIREFLTRNHVPYNWQDLESSRETTQLLKEFKVSEDDTPLVVLPNGDVLLAPPNAKLAEALGIRRAAQNKVYDLVVVGAGPAGLSAGVYGASEGLSTLIIDSEAPGGQAGNASRIENYMGFPLGITGHDLATGAVVQAEKFGAQIMVAANVTSIACGEAGGHEAQLDGKESLACRCMILAPGADYRKLELDNLGDVEGRGVYYAATHVERILCGSNNVAVVGGGNSAGQAAIFLSENASQVFLVVRGNELRDNMSSYLARRIENSSKITVFLNSEVCQLRHDDWLNAITIRNRKTGEEQTEDVVALFCMLGAVPHTAWLPDAIAKDEKGYIITGQQLVEKKSWNAKRSPYYLETSCPGIFAAGDARADSIKRVASAVGEGSMAVALIHQYLAL